LNEEKKEREAIKKVKDKKHHEDLLKHDEEFRKQ
jgi:hypothetical protein